MNRLIIAALATASLAFPALAQQAPKATPASVAALVADTIKGASAEWKARMTPDETQNVCS